MNQLSTDLTNVDNDLEQRVLGTVLAEPRLAGVLLKYIKKPKVFYRPAHQLIFGALHGLYATGEAIDLITVSNWLRTNGHDLPRTDLLELMHGRPLLTIDRHCLILFELAIKRYLNTYGAKLQRAAMDPHTDALSVLHQIGGDIDDIMGSIAQIHQKTTVDHLEEVFTDIADKQAGRKKGFTLGIDQLDERTGGFAPGNFVIIAAGTAQGKTGVTIHATRHLCLEENVPVGVVTLEMKGSEYMARFVASESNFSNSDLNRATGIDVADLRAATARLRTMPLQLHDKPVQLPELVLIIREWVRRHGVKVVVVDYLQLVQDSRFPSTKDRVSNISTTLKSLASELDILIIALSQLSREWEKRTGTEKRPQLSDLRESGQLEQDANAVIFLFRPFKFGIQYEDGSADKFTMEVAALKLRGAEPSQRHEPWLYDYDGACNRLVRFGSMRLASEASLRPYRPAEFPPTDLTKWVHEPKENAGF